MTIKKIDGNDLIDALFNAANWLMEQEKEIEVKAAYLFYGEYGWELVIHYEVNTNK